MLPFWGSDHQSVCEAYEGKKNPPMFTDISPETLIALISKKTQRRLGRGSDGVNITTPNDGEDLEDEPFKTKRITQLDHQIIKTGLYDENPYDTTYMGSKYRYIDFVVFDKWAKYIWGHGCIVPLGARIVDARWIGSFNFDADTSGRIIIMMKESKELWLSSFWHDRVTKDIVFARFCLDLSDC